MSLEDWNKEFDKLSDDVKAKFHKTLEEALPHLDRDLKNLISRAPTQEARAYASLDAARIRKQIIGIIRNLQAANDYPEK